MAGGILDIDWFDERGEHLSEDDWHNPEGRALVVRRTRRKKNGDLEAVTMLMNGSHEPLVFHLPPPLLSRFLVIDSADPQAPERAVGETIEVLDRAAMLIVGTDPP